MTVDPDYLDPEDADRPDDEVDHDRFFSGLMVPANDTGESLARAALEDLESHERTAGTRRKARKAADQARWVASVTALVCEVAHERLTDPGSTLGVSLDATRLSKKSRYRLWYTGKTYIAAVHALADRGFLAMVLGQWSPFGRGRLTTIAAGPRLIEAMRALQAVEDDFRRDDSGRELIELRSRKVRVHGRLRSEKLEYQDCETTNRMRAELCAINAWIAQADIACRDRRFRTERRTLYRVFNNASFELGGRLHGGFWQQMPKADRLAALTIAGEEVASLDFGQFNPRAAYGVAGIEPAFSDAYSIPERPWHGRDAVKTVLNVLLSADKPTTKQPRGLGMRTADFRTLASDVRRVHAPIAHLFGTGIGLTLQYRESQATVAALLRLKDEGIVALPVHDCLIVGRSAVARAAEVMAEEATKATGVVIPVTVEQAPEARLAA